MKKVTSALIVAFTTAIFAGSAMAATSTTPASHAGHKVGTHQMHKQKSHAQKHQTGTQKAPEKKVEDKAPVAK